MDIQYLLSLLTDVKILLIVIVVGLLVALAIYTWRQTKELQLLKSQQDMIKEQVKHKLILSDHTNERPEMASNMSEESTVKEADDEWEDDDEDDSQDHSSYIREIINMQDKKRSPEDDYYIARESNKPGYESDEDKIVFDNYEDDEDDDDQEVSQAEVVNGVQEVAGALASAPAPAHASSHLTLKAKAETQLIQRIEQDIKRLDNSSLYIAPIPEITKIKPFIEAKQDKLNAEKPKPIVEEPDKVLTTVKPKILIIEKPKLLVGLKEDLIQDKKTRGRPKGSKSLKV
jgi:hypothetical protein